MKNRFEGVGWLKKRRDVGRRSKLTKPNPKNPKTSIKWTSDSVGITLLNNASDEGHFHLIPMHVYSFIALYCRSWIRKRAWALENACKLGDDDQAKTILNLVEDANERQETINANSGSLYWASANGHDGLVTFLIDQGANVNLAYGRVRAVHGAADNGHAHVVRLLLDKGASVKAGGDPEGAKVLRRAIKNGRGDIVRLLLEGGANMDAKIEEEDAKTSMEFAQESGRHEIERILVEHRLKNQQSTAF